MEHRIDHRLRDEAKHFRLVFTCGGCAHFDPEQARCAHGYPTEPHDRDKLEERDVLTFCKHFELW